MLQNENKDVKLKMQYDKPQIIESWFINKEATEIHIEIK